MELPLIIVDENRAKCPTCGHIVVRNNVQGNYNSFCRHCAQDFLLTEEQKKIKNTTSTTHHTKIRKSERVSHPTAEIRKYAKLKDDGLITEEEYQVKKKELLGL